MSSDESRGIIYSLSKSKTHCSLHNLTKSLYLKNTRLSNEFMSTMFWQLLWYMIYARIYLERYRDSLSLAKTQDSLIIFNTNYELNCKCDCKQITSSCKEYVFQWRLLSLWGGKTWPTHCNHMHTLMYKQPHIWCFRCPFLR